MADHYGAKAIFLEKPPHYNSIELYEFVELHSPKCAVGFNYRFHPAIKTLKKHVKTSPAARLMMLAYDDVENWPQYNEDSWLLGKYGGALLTSASHSIDAAIWLLGEVYSVKCLELENDLVDLVLKHNSGATTVICIKWKGPKASTIHYLNENIVAMYNLLDCSENMHYNMMSSFLNYYVHGTTTYTPICSLKESLEVMKVIDMARESYERKEVVKC